MKNKQEQPGANGNGKHEEEAVDANLEGGGAEADERIFCSIEEALEEIRSGRFIVVADDEGRENEGDLIGAAELVTPDMINFMVTEARGWVCLAITPDKAGKAAAADDGRK